MRKMFPFEDAIMFQDDCMIFGLWWNEANTKAQKHIAIFFRTVDETL